MLGNWENSINIGYSVFGSCYWDEKTFHGLFTFLMYYEFNYNSQGVGFYAYFTGEGISYLHILSLVGAILVPILIMEMVFLSFIYGIYLIMEICI